jgi:hypothetical protein
MSSRNKDKDVSKVTKEIIKNRTDLHADVSTLFNLVRDGEKKKVVKHIKKDLNVVSRQYQGGWYGGNNSLLHVAAYWGRLDITKELVKYGCDIEAKTNAGYTPLMVACVCGYADVCKYLLDKGANILHCENFERSCSDLMHSSIVNDIEEYFIRKTQAKAQAATKDLDNDEDSVVSQLSLEEQEKVNAEKKEKEKERVLEKFNKVDVDGSGALDSEELYQVCADLGLQLDEEELEAALAILDENGDGSISFEEFYDWWGS